MAVARAFPILLAGVWLPALAAAHPWEPPFGDKPAGGPGGMVGVSIEVDGRAAPLYASRDGSDRWYLEAREGSRYSVRLVNRSGGRLGVVLTVDGLNAISGQKDAGPGRMYVLGPWDETTVSGWRTSLSDVRRFTFVDERASYAARSGKATRRMGRIEVEVYRERRPYVRRYWWEEGWAGRRPKDDGEARSRLEAPPPPAGSDDKAAAAPPATAKSAPAPDAAIEGREADGRYPPPERRDSYPGTGWGSRAYDPVVVVDFDPEGAPADRVTVRYEYASALRALGIFPRPYWTRDRLRERERGAEGFAPPPLW